MDVRIAEIKSITVHLKAACITKVIITLIRVTLLSAQRHAIIADAERKCLEAAIYEQRV